MLILFDWFILQSDKWQVFFDIYICAEYFYIYFYIKIIFTEITKPLDADVNCYTISPQSSLKVFQGTSYVDIDTYSCAHDKHEHKNPRSPGVFIINETDNVIFQSHVIAPAGTRVVFAKGLHKICHKKAAPGPSDHTAVSHKGWLIDVQLLLRLSITLRITWSCKRVMDHKTAAAIWLLFINSDTTQRSLSIFDVHLDGDHK